MACGSVSIPICIHYSILMIVFQEFVFDLEDHAGPSNSAGELPIPGGTASSSALDLFDYTGEYKCDQ